MILSVKFILFSYYNFWRTSFNFSGDVCPRFQNQTGFPYLDALLPACNEFLRFTSDDTPVDLLADSMPANSAYPFTCSSRAIDYTLYSF